MIRTVPSNLEFKGENHFLVETHFICVRDFIVIEVRIMQARRFPQLLKIIFTEER